MEITAPNDLTVVASGEYEDYTVLAVFDTKADAEAWMTSYNAARTDEAKAFLDGELPHNPRPIA